MPKQKCPMCGKLLKDIESHIKRVHQKEEKTKVFNIMRNESFCKIYVTRTLTSFTEFDFRVTAMNEKTIFDNDEVYVADLMACLTPLAAKELSIQLTGLVSKWEEKKGEIKTRPKKSLYTAMEVR